MIYKVKVLPCNLKAKFENFIFTYGVLLIHLQYHFLLPSVLWRCWLGGRKGIWPVKNTEWWGAGVVICLELGADLHAAQLMPLPLTISCFIKIQTGFTSLVPAHPGSPGKRAIKRVCVCVVISFLMLCFYCMRGQLLTGHDGSTSSRECRRSRRQTAQCHAANLECWVESAEDDRSGQATIW